MAKPIDAEDGEQKVPESRLPALAAKEIPCRHQNAKLLADLNRAHNSGSTAEEIEVRKAWKRQYRSRIEDEW